MEISGHFCSFAALVFVVGLSLQLRNVVAMPYFEGEHEQPATGRNFLIYRGYSSLFFL
jgi:hypothetical protein